MCVLISHPYYGAATVYELLTVGPVASDCYYRRYRYYFDVFGSQKWTVVYYVRVVVSSPRQVISVSIDQPMYGTSMVSTQDTNDVYWSGLLGSMSNIKFFVFECLNEFLEQESRRSLS